MRLRFLFVVVIVICSFISDSYAKTDALDGDGAAKSALCNDDPELKKPPYKSILNSGIDDNSRGDGSDVKPFNHLALQDKSFQNLLDYVDRFLNDLYDKSCRDPKMTAFEMLNNAEFKCRVHCGSMGKTIGSKKNAILTCQNACVYQRMIMKAFQRGAVAQMRISHQDLRACEDRWVKLKSDLEVVSGPAVNDSFPKSDRQISEIIKLVREATNPGAAKAK